MGIMTQKKLSKILKRHEEWIEKQLIRRIYEWIM